MPLPSSDIYSAIVGDPPTDQEKLAALVEQLRRKQGLGELGMVTGDKVLAPMGKGMISGAQDQAQMIGGYQARRREVEAMNVREKQAQLARAMEAEQNRKFEAEQRALDRRERALDRAMRERIERDYKGQTKTDAQTERGIMRVSTLMNKDNMAGLIEATSAINGQLGLYKDRPLPGIGRVQGLMPDIAVSDEAQLLRSNLSGVANQLLKLRSGAAVTDQEMRRFLREVANGVFDESVFRKRWPEVLKVIEAEQNNILASADSGGQEEYFARTGLQKFRAYDPFAESLESEPSSDSADYIPSFEEWKASRK
jgi:hypothetical protein